MKLLAASAMALCLFFVGCAETSTSGPATELIEANNQVLANIEGMDCTGCSGSVCAALEQIDGVTMAHADHATGDVKVALSDDVQDPEAVKDAIQATLVGLSDGKYTVNEINTFTKEDAAPATGEAEQTEPADEPAAEQADGDEQANASDTVYVTASYNVTGMDCTGCSSQIVRAVEKVDGVQKVEANHTNGSVKVAFADEFDDKVKIDEIKDVIAGLSNGKYTVSK